MLNYIHKELAPIKDADDKVHECLQTLARELDKVVETKVQQKIYVIHYYDENEANTFVECHFDYATARKRFVEIMLHEFPEISKLNVDWNSISEYRDDDFEFTTDRYVWFYNRRSATGKYDTDLRYPKNTWYAWSLNYYSELYMKNIPIGESIILFSKPLTND